MLSYCRWVLVRKRDPEARIEVEAVPNLAKAVAPEELAAGLPPLDGGPTISASPAAPPPRRLRGRRAHRPRRRMTVEEAEHQIATRLFQNTAKVHFDGFAAKDTRFGKR